MNLNEDQLKISILSDDLRQQVAKATSKFIAHKMLETAKAKFNNAFRHYFQKNTPPGITRYFFTLVGFTPQHGVEHFTTDFFVTVAMKCIYEYSVQTEKPFREYQPDGSVIFTHVSRLDSETDL